jgi:AAA family ATP:ADP antiporter
VVSTAGLLTIAGALLLIAIVCVARILRLAQRVPRLDQVDIRQQAVGGGIFSGLTHALRSPYLLNIGLYILLYTITSTFLYFQQATIARDYFSSTASRTAFFASIDLIVNVLTLVAQLFLTSRVLRHFGVAVAAAFLPVLTVVGFTIFAVAPTMIVLVAFQVLRRVGNFGLAKPTRELLFTVIPREDKYKAKNMLDTVVYRLGDQAGSWSYALLGMAGLGAAGVAVAAIPVALLWVGNGLWLGRRHDKLAASQPDSADNVDLAAQLRNETS